MRSMESIADILRMVRVGCVRDAELACERLVARAEDCAQALALLAEIQLANGRTSEAIKNLTALRSLRPHDAANHRRLGAALLSLDRKSEAADALRRAIELEPRNERAHNNLGQALLQCGEQSDALRHFETALALNPHYAVGHNNLGLALTAAGRFADAVAAFERAIALDSGLLIARFNLAIGYERLGNMQQALEAYEQILASDPRHIDALARHGAVCAKLHRSEDALRSLDAALVLRPGDAVTLALKASVLLTADRAAEALQVADEALRLRGDYTEALNIKAGALWKLDGPEDALDCIHRAVELDPNFVDAWCTGASLHLYLGDSLSAAESYRRAISLDPGCIRARTGLLSSMVQAMPASSAEDMRARAGFDRELTSLEEWLRDRELGETDAWQLASQLLFYLTYQEQPNGQFLERYRRRSSHCLAAVSPASSAATAGAESVAGSRRRRSGRMRLGLVSSHVFDHSVYSAITRGWLSQLDRNQFELTIYSLGSMRDAFTAEAAALVDRFEHGPRRPAEWARLIRQSGLDALLFPEIGMEPTTLALANLRLAPQQYAAWGHPETSGLPTIDYFLSARAFEPPDADDHYSETLISLPNLGVHYLPYGIAPAAVDLGQLGISDRGPVFICPGAPFKYRPDDDAVLVDIARRVAHSTFIFFEHKRAGLSARHRARVSAAFEDARLNPQRQLKWIPWLPRPEFLGLLRRSDVYLDTIGFSGFNTMMQAVEVHLPAVTHEGRFMRGRLGSGIMRTLQLPELVAGTRSEYAGIAVHLAQSPQYRSELRAKLRGVERLAYADRGAAAALAEVLLQHRSR